jgi:uncharacterized sulfatase
MNRRDFLKGLGVGAASFVVAGCSGVPVFGEDKTGKKPNIVFILADDFGWHQLGCYGSRFYETPNLDTLAAEGMKFTDAYAAAPVCSPTRASIMEALKGAGYVTGHFGKWHLNKDKGYRPGRPGDPGSQGFDDVLTTTKPRSNADPDADAHHVKEITDRAINFIRANTERPFFCYITHNTIHRPEMETKDLVSKYENKPGADDDKNRAVLGAMVETLDKNTGRFLSALEELKLADNTIVIFFGDNGALGKHETLKPLRGAKGSLVEGGIREPMIVRWPGYVKEGTLCSEPVTSCDFYPTLLEIAGLEINDPTVDGESLLPLLKQKGKLKRDAIYWHYPHYSPQNHFPAGVVREGKYKLIEWYEKSIDGVDTPGAIELYDLEKDISEQHDLAKKMPVKARELYEKLRNWRKRVGAQEMLKNPNYTKR